MAVEGKRVWVYMGTDYAPMFTLNRQTEMDEFIEVDEKVYLAWVELNRSIQVAEDLVINSSKE